MPTKLDDEIQKLHMVAPTKWVKRIDDWRRKQPDLPNLSAAIRQLVDMGLESDEKETLVRQQRDEGDEQCTSPWCHQPHRRFEVRSAPNNRHRPARRLVQKCHKRTHALQQTASFSRSPRLRGRAAPRREDRGRAF